MSGLERPARRLICRDMTDDNEVAFRGLARILEAAGGSPASAAAYHAACLSMEDYLTAAGRPADLLAATRDDVCGWLIELQARGGWRLRDGGLVQLGRPLARESVFSYFGSLGRFYRYAAGEQLIDASPMAGLAAPPKETRPRDIPEIGVLRAMIATCNPKGRKRTFDDFRDEFLIRFFAETGGPRCAEVAFLPSERLDLRNDVALVEGKGGKWRTIPLCASTAQAATRYVAARKRHRAAHLPALVLGTKGQLSPSGVYQVVRRRGKMAGARIHPHQLRHYGADAAKLDGMSDEDVMRLFGWSTTAMLRHYGEAHADARAIAAARRHRLGDRL